MRRIHVIGLAVAAVLALSAVSASAASAHEFTKGVGSTVTGVSGVSVLKASTITITCKTGSIAEGSVSSATTVSISSIVFSECTVKKGTCEKPIGDIHSAAITGTLVASAESKTGVALLLAPTTGKVFAEVEKTECNPASKVEGTIAGEVTPINTASTTGDVVFSIPNIAEVEKAGGEKVKPKLTVFGASARLESTEENTFSELVEVV